MPIPALLDNLFQEFMEGRIPQTKIAELHQQLDASHVELLLRKVEAIGDPSDYCNADETYAPVQEFFLFIDLVSALILSLGEPGRSKLAQFPDSKSQYIAWIRQYVTDQRFHAQIQAQFPL